MKILLVDDEETMRGTIACILRSKGFEVIEASGGDEAFEMFKEQQSDISLVVSDIRMPDGDGVELLKNIKETNSETPVVIMTGYSEYDEKDIINLKAEQILQKPFNPVSFFQMVEKYQ